jgi:3-hydroxyisobutyrate dehydrogenase-like beta-hydroxyacid dehydrogenase
MDRTLGIVGVGRMGGAMWRHLHGLGHTAIVFDTAGAAVDALAAEGAKAASSAREVGASADTVICSLPRSDDVAVAVLGDDGVAAGARPGALVIDTTSGSPSRTRDIAAECAARGVAYVDAGVSGGVAGAGSGNLNIMVGGSDDDFAAARPVLDLLGNNVWHCGVPGTGHATKTVLNLANQGKMLLEIEALLVGRAAGLDAHQMAEILGLGTWQMFLMGPGGRRQFGFSLGMSVKDYDVGVGLAEEEDVPIRTLAAAHHTMHAILDEIGPDADIIEYVSVLEHDANVELPNHGH